MPAEWEPHEATWLSWPKNPLTFPPRVIEHVEATFCEIIKAISFGEKVKVLFDNGAAAGKALKKIEAAEANLKNVEPQFIRSSDVWMRDYGPTFLLNRQSGKKAAVKWTFNAWGEKYDDLLYDNIAGEKVAEAAAVEIFKPGMVLEGGSIDVNGVDTVLTTEQCLLNPNRNPNRSKQEIEEKLKQFLGASNVLWLKEGISGDDTDGHIDDFARFANAKQILCAVEPNKSDDNFSLLAENRELLESSAFEIIELPMPRPLVDQEEDRRLPASYANFYIANKAVLLPVFGDPKDREAEEILQSCFPNREILPIAAKALVFGYGGIHCVTQQEPKG